MITRKITIEGIEFEAAATPLVHLANAQKFLTPAGIQTEEGMRALVQAIFWGIRRARHVCEKSGGITKEWLEENIDSHNGKEIFDLFAEINGISRLSNKGADLGEAAAASPHS